VAKEIWHTLWQYLDPRLLDIFDKQAPRLHFELNETTFLFPHQNHLLSSVYFLDPGAEAHNKPLE
jgi:hypothetical protein